MIRHTGVAKRQDAISREAFRHVERELYRYHETKRDIERIERDIILRGMAVDLSAQGSQVQWSAEWSDMTGTRATALAEYHKLKEMRRIVEAIEDVLALLDDERRALVAAYYWDHPAETWDFIADLLKYDVRTLQRWRRAIVEAIAERLGWR